MTILLDQLTSAVAQVAALTFIPFVYYLLTRRKTRGFWSWLGFTRARKTPVKPMAAVFFGLLIVIAPPYFRLYQEGTLTLSGFMVDAYRAYGWSAQTIATALIWAIIQTSLSEEIFFRGFLGKRLSHALGWKTGTAIQATVFGLVRVVSMWEHGIAPTLLIFLLTGATGFLLGWLSMRKADESILYGWPVHAAVNIATPLLAFAFLL